MKSLAASRSAACVVFRACDQSGTFVIHDGSERLLGDLDSANIAQLGTINGLNTVGTANSERGSHPRNADLLALKNAVNGLNTLSFQFGQATHG